MRIEITETSMAHPLKGISEYPLNIMSIKWNILHGITSIECLYILHSSFFEADGHRWSASGQESQGATNERNPAEGGPRRHENRGSRWVGLKPSFRKKRPYFCDFDYRKKRNSRETQIRHIVIFCFL